MRLWERAIRWRYQQPSTAVAQNPSGRLPGLWQRVWGAGVGKPVSVRV